MPVAVIAREQCYCAQCGNWRPETDFSEFARDQFRRGDEEARCQECINKLFKNRLQKGSGEIAAYIAEDRARKLQRTRNPMLEQMVGEGRWGKSLHSNELIRRLQKIIPNIVPAPGLTRWGQISAAGVVWSKDAKDLWLSSDDDLSLYRVRNEQVDSICWTAQGHLPEFSIVYFNRDRQPLMEQRGWRTVLLRLIKTGLLTEELAQKEFGHPTHPEQARFWAQQLYNLRNDRTPGHNFEQK